MLVWWLRSLDYLVPLLMIGTLSVMIGALIAERCEIQETGEVHNALMFGVGERLKNFGIVVLGGSFYVMVFPLGILLFLALIMWAVVIIYDWLRRYRIEIRIVER